MLDKKDIQVRELEARLSEMELEKVKLMNASSERLRALKEVSMEKEELMSEVKSSRIELATLAGMDHQTGYCSPASSFFGLPSQPNSTRPRKDGLALPVHLHCADLSAATSLPSPVCSSD